MRTISHTKRRQTSHTTCKLSLEGNAGCWYERCFVDTVIPNYRLRRCAMAFERIARIEETLRRVQGEFREMPGLRLTPAQASRLWGLDAVSSQALLDALVDARFL